MRWRCNSRSGPIRCMFAPGHAGDHGALTAVFGTQGMFYWANVEELIEEVYPEVEIVAEVIPEPKTIELPPSGNRAEVYAGRSDLAGRRPTRKTLNNPYAALDEGVHINWGLFGHEIPPYPTLDELEGSWA